MSTSCTVIRVRRKRSASMIGAALVLSFKRNRIDESGQFRRVYRFANVADAPDAPDVDCELSSIADLDALKLTIAESTNDQVDSTGPLACLNDVVDEIASAPNIPEQQHSSPRIVTLNGIPLASSIADANVDDDFVYDFYVSKGAPNDTDNYWKDLIDVRLVADDQELVDDDDDGESEAADDDDDSNDENNWRNDYPDEDDEEDGSVSPMIDYFDRMPNFNNDDDD